MNVIDLGLVIILLFSVYNGYLRGFITGMLQLIVLAAGLLSAFSVCICRGFFRQNCTLFRYLEGSAFFYNCSFYWPYFFSFIANRLLSVIPESSHTSTANHIIGIVPGAINGFMWAIIVAALLLLVPFSDRLSALSSQSKLAGRLADKVDWIDEKLSPFLDEVAKTPFGKTRIDPGAEKSVSLPFKDDDPKVRADLEAKMLVLVNEERRKVGLKPLKADPEMLVVARAHSKDMFARGYFSHETPDGFSPFDRMKKAKVRFMAAGENLALGQTLNICHRGLMNSPGHRKNILNPIFGRVGIGILDGGFYGLIITQNFRN